MRPSRAPGLRLLGFFLPVLGGGNHFLFLEPEPALAILGAVLAGVALLELRIPGDARRGGTALAALAVLALVTVLQFALRETGPSAATTTRTILFAALAFFVFAARPSAIDDLRALAGGLALGTLATAAYGQYQYWEAFPRIAPLIRASGHTPITAVNANFYAANTYAPFVAAVALLVLPLAARGERPGDRLLAGAALPALLVTLVLTESRATWAALALACGLVALRGRRLGGIPASRWVVGGTVGAALIVAVVAAAGPDDLVRVGMLGRLRIWAAALRMIADHWWIGVGLGTFGEAFPRYQLDAYFTRYPHNMALEVFAELGLAAAAALAAFLVAGFGTARRSLARAPERGPGHRFAIALVAAALLLMIHAAVDIDWHAPANLILLVLLLALAIDPPAGPEGARV